MKGTYSSLYLQAIIYIGTYRAEPRKAKKGIDSCVKEIAVSILY